MKTIKYVLFFLLVTFFVCASVSADDWEIADGGASADHLNSNVFAEAGTGGVVISINMGTGNKLPFFQRNQPIAPIVTITAPEEADVDAYIALVLNEYTYYYDPDLPLRIASSPALFPVNRFVEYELINYTAGQLAGAFPNRTFSSFGVFVRVVESGTGSQGKVIAERAFTTFLTEAELYLPLPAQAPWED